MSPLFIFERLAYSKLLNPFTTIKLAVEWILIRIENGVICLFIFQSTCKNVAFHFKRCGIIQILK